MHTCGPSAASLIRVLLPAAEETGERPQTSGRRVVPPPTIRHLSPSLMAAPIRLARLWEGGVPRAPAFYHVDPPGAMRGFFDLGLSRFNDRLPQLDNALCSGACYDTSSPGSGFRDSWTMASRSMSSS